MSILAKTFIFSCTSLFSVVAGAACEQVEIQNDTDFLTKVKSNIEMYNKHRESKDGHEYTMVRIVGRKMELEEFCDIYHSLHGMNVSEKMVSVITIRNFHVNVIHNPAEYLNKVIKAIQAHANQNDSHVLLDGLGLSIEYFKYTNIGGFDLLHTASEQIYKKYKIFNEMIIKNFSAICFDAFENIIRALVCDILHQHADLDSLEKFRDKCLMDACAEVEYQNITSKIRSLAKKNELAWDYDWDLTGENSVFAKLYTEMFENDNASQNENYSVAESNLDCLYELHVKRKHKEVFQQGINDLTMLYLPILTAARSKNLFVQSFTTAYNEMNDYLQRQNVLNTGEGNIKQYADRFCDDERFKNIIHKYIKSMYSEKIQISHQNTYKILNETICRELHAEYITKIFYNGKIDSNSINKVCDAIINGNIFKELYHHQSVFIDEEKIITKDRAGKCLHIFYTFKFDSDADVKFAEISSMIKATNKDTKCTGLMNFRLKRVVFDGRDEIETSYTKLPPTSNEVLYTIYRCDEQICEIFNEDIKCAKQLCLANNKSEHVDTHLVSIYSSYGSHFIYIFQHKKKDSNEKITALIFDLPKTNTSVKESKCRQANRLIKCFDNIPSTYLTIFNDHLQFSQLTRSEHYKVPFLHSIDDIDFVSTEINMSFESFIELTSETYPPTSILAKQYRTFVLTQKITLKQIINYKAERDYKCKQLSAFIKNLGIDEALFNRILWNLVLNNRVIEFAGADANTLDKYCTSRGIMLYLTRRYNQYSVFHFAEIGESMSFHNVVITPSKILEKTLECMEGCDTISELDHAMKKCRLKGTFIATVMVEICKQMNYNVMGRCNVNVCKQKQKCLGIIYGCIESLFRKLIEMEDECDNDNNRISLDCLYSVNLQKLLKPNDLARLAEIIAQELEEFTGENKVKVTSVKVKVKNKGRNINVSDFGSKKMNEVYENVESLELSNCDKIIDQNKTR